GVIYRGFGPSPQHLLELLCKSSDILRVIQAVDDTAGVKVITPGIIDKVRELLAGEASVSHAKGHDLVSRLWFERVLRMQQQERAHPQFLAHVGVIRLPGELHITATIIGVGKRRPIGISDFHRNAVRTPLPFTELLNWLPPAGTFPT